MTPLIGAAMAVIAGQAPAAVSSPSGASKLDLFKRMEWLNEPASASQHDGGLPGHNRPGPDFWQNNFYGYVTDNRHSYLFPAGGEVIFQAHVNGTYDAQYDQTDLAIRLEERQGMQYGSELASGKRQAGVALAPDCSERSSDDVSQSDNARWRALPRKDSTEVQCSKDGVAYTIARENYFAPDVAVTISVMCAAPED
jgi:regulation of enolase protein 1 (concanavalin A-like superfamily)